MDEQQQDQSKVGWGEGVPLRDQDLTRRVEELEQRVAALEKQLAGDA